MSRLDPKFFKFFCVKRAIALFVVIALVSSSLVGCTALKPIPEKVFLDTVPYKKEVFFHDPQVGYIQQIKIGNFDHDSEEEILVIVQDGYLLLSMNGQRKQFVPFKTEPNPVGVSADDLDGDGQIELFGFVKQREARIPIFWERETLFLVLYDSNGNLKWKQIRYQGDSAVLFDDPPTAGDIDGDGKKEILFSGAVFNTNDNLLFDINKRDNPLRPTKFADVNNDNRPEIVAAAYRIFNGLGKELAGLNIDHSFAGALKHFSITYGPEGKSLIPVNESYADEICLVNMNSQIEQRFQAPLTQLRQL